MIAIETLEARDSPAIVGIRLIGDMLRVRGTPPPAVLVRRVLPDGVRVEVGQRWWQWDQGDVRTIRLDSARPLILASDSLRLHSRHLLVRAGIVVLISDTNPLTIQRVIPERGGAPLSISR